MCSQDQNKKLFGQVSPGSSPNLGSAGQLRLSPKLTVEKSKEELARMKRELLAAHPQDHLPHPLVKHPDRALQVSTPRATSLQLLL